MLSIEQKIDALLDERKTTSSSHRMSRRKSRMLRRQVVTISIVSILVFSFIGIAELYSHLGGVQESSVTVTGNTPPCQLDGFNLVDLEIADDLIALGYGESAIFEHILTTNGCFADVSISIDDSWFSSPEHEWYGYTYGVEDSVSNPVSSLVLNPDSVIPLYFWHTCDGAIKSCVVDTVITIDTSRFHPTGQVGLYGDKTGVFKSWKEELNVYTGLGVLDYELDDAGDTIAEFDVISGVWTNGGDGLSGQTSDGVKAEAVSSSCILKPTVYTVPDNYEAETSFDYRMQESTTSGLYYSYTDSDNYGLITVPWSDINTIKMIYVYDSVEHVIYDDIATWNGGLKTIGISMLDGVYTLTTDGNIMSTGFFGW